MLVFRKHYTCQHKFGCIESILRKTFKYMAYWFCAKGVIQFVSGLDLGTEAISQLKDNWTGA